MLVDITPEAMEILRVLAELAANEDDADILDGIYGISIENPDDCQLDMAISEWHKTGCPLPEGDIHKMGNTR